MGSYVPPTSLLSSIFLPNPLKDVKKEDQGNTDSNSQDLQASATVNKWKQAEVKNILFLFLPPCPSPLHLISFNNHDHNQLREDDIMNFTMLFNLPYHLFSLLTLPPNQMASLNRNPEDRANEGDLNVPAQTQKLQAMAPIMVNTQHHVTEQAFLSQNYNTTTDDSHSVSSTLLPPPFDKEKILAM